MIAAIRREVPQVDKTRYNEFTNSSYANINDYLDAINPILERYGVLLLQPTQFSTDGRVLVETILVHILSGEWIASGLNITPSKPQDPQSVGSALTYARRYALVSLLALSAYDDDGNAGSGRHQPPTKTRSMEKATQRSTSTTSLSNKPIPNTSVANPGPAPSPKSQVETLKSPVENPTDQACGEYEKLIMAIDMAEHLREAYMLKRKIDDAHKEVGFSTDQLDDLNDRLNAKKKELR